MKTRLRHVTRDDLTIRRRRRGRGFCFLDPTGAVISDPGIKARLRALAIPPAWEDVCIAPDERAHIQVIGRDAADRVQYIYHPDWEEQRRERKEGHLILLAEALPRIRRRVARDLEAPAGSLELALAIAVGLIDRTAIRAGEERYLKSSGTRGASTLMTRDVRLKRGAVRLTFNAKGGRRAQYEVQDRRLATAIARIKTLTGQRLLVYRDEAGEIRPINTSMINDYIKSSADAPVTAKDFRTLHASALAAGMMASITPAHSKTARKRQLADVTRRVADALHNTPAISRKSYIAPVLFELFDDGRLHFVSQGGAVRRGLRRSEGLLSVLFNTVEG